MAHRYILLKFSFKRMGSMIRGDGAG